MELEIYQDSKFVLYLKIRPYNERYSFEKWHILIAYFSNFDFRGCLRPTYTRVQKFNHASFRYIHKPPDHDSQAGVSQHTSKKGTFSIIPLTLNITFRECLKLWLIFVCNTWQFYWHTLYIHFQLRAIGTLENWIILLAILQ